MESNFQERCFRAALHTISLDRAAFDKIAPYVETLAEAEGLDAHAESIRVRHESTASRVD